MESRPGTAKAQDGHARACQTCNLAKAKCVPRSNAPNDPCERCYRLKKDCATRAPAVRKPRSLRRNRVAQLEEKLDGIVSLLQSSQGGTPSPSITGHPPPVKSPITPPSSEAFAAPGPVAFTHSTSASQVEYTAQAKPAPGQNAILPPTPIQGRGVLQQQLPKSNAAASETYELDDMEVDRLIRIYQDEMIDHSPFVILPPDTRAADLRLKQPLLYKAIIMATSFNNPARQSYYGRQVLEHITEHLLIRNEKNLELLQGILLFTAWYKKNFLLHPQLNNFLQLGVALIVDLGLNKQPSAKVGSRSDLGGVKQRTMEERRAVVGCFYLTSVVSTCFSKLDAMRFTSHLEDCCQVLKETPEYFSDVHLVYLVKIQHIMERIGQTLHSHNDWNSSSTATRAPVGLHIRGFEAEIQALKESLPQELQQNVTFLMHCDLAAIRLHEIALGDAFSTQSASVLSAPATTNISVISNPSQVDVLYALLLASKSFVNRLLSVPCETYLALPFIPWAQFVYALIITYRLTFFTSPSCPNWDVAFVRSILDFSSALKAFATKFEDARAQALDLMAQNGELNNSELMQRVESFERIVTKIRNFKSWWFEHMVKSGQGGQNGTIANKTQVLDDFKERVSSSQAPVGITATAGPGTANAPTQAPQHGPNTYPDVTMQGSGYIDDMFPLDPSFFEGWDEEAFWANCTREWGDTMSPFGNL